MFTYKVDVPTEDGKSTEPHELKLRAIEDIPVGILRKNRRDFESLMWATFEWGLDPEQLELFDRLPVAVMHQILEAWQESVIEEETKDEPDDGDDTTAGEPQEAAQADGDVGGEPEPAPVKQLHTARKKKG